MARSDGAYNTAEGDGGVATGGPSHVEGTTCTASGLNSHAEGLSSVASGAEAHAGGVLSDASRLAQFSRASGQIAAPLDAQFCQVYMMLQTTDAAGHKLLVGGAGGSLLYLEDNKSYCYRIMVVARSTDSGLSSTWEAVGGMKRVGGVSSAIGVLPAATNIANDGGVSAVWSVVPVLAIATNSLDVVVATGGVPQTVNWVAAVDWVETFCSPL